MAAHAIPYQPPSVSQHAQAPCAAAQLAQPCPFSEQRGEQQKLRIVEDVTDFHDIDWSFPLHDQLRPRLWGQRPQILTPDELRETRKNSPNWSKKRFHTVMQRQSAYIDVQDEERGTHVRVDLKIAAAYILTVPQWFNTLNQPIMLCIWVKDWKSAALFQYFLDTS